jgi:alanine racemase
MSNGCLRPTWCEIDLGAVAHNILQLRSIVAPQVKLYVCQKGDAYGCGASAVDGEKAPAAT